MMAFGIYTYLFAVLVYRSQQDIQLTSYYCSNNPKSWKEAMDDCFASNGKPVSFLNDQDKVDIIEGLHIWTGDYAKESKKGTTVCGFTYLNSTHYVSSQRDILYGDCDVHRFFFYKQDGAWMVSENARRGVDHKHKISDRDLAENSQIISPGYYWVTNSLKIEEHVLHAQADLKTSDILCGAYETDVGRYFTRCDKHLSSLCNLSDHSVSSGSNVSTLQTGSVSGLDNINEQEKFNKACLMDFGSLTGLLAKKKNKQKNNDKQITTTQASAENTEIGVLVGIPTGIGLAVICGVLVTIFIVRRNKVLRYKIHSDEAVTDAAQSRDNHANETEEHVTNRTESNEDNDIHVYTEASSEEVSTDVVNSARHVEGFETTDLNETYNYCYPEEERNEQVISTTRRFDMDDSSNHDYDKLKQHTQYFALNDLSMNKRTDNFYNTMEANVEYNTTSNSNRRKEYADTYGKIQDQEEYNVIGNISTPNTIDNVYGKMVDDEEYDKTGNVRRNKPTDNIYNKMSIEHAESK